MDLNQADASAFSSFDPGMPDIQINLEAIENFEVKELISKITSKVPDLELEGITSLRRLISKKQVKIQELVLSNIIPNLLMISKEKDEKFLQQLCHILINVSAGNSRQTEFIIELSCIEFFCQIFDSHPNSWELLYDVVWSIGNISIESDQLRNIVVDSKLFTLVLDFTETCISQQLFKYLETCMWVLANFLGIDETLDVTSLDRILLVVLKALNITKDDLVIHEIVFTLSCMAKKHINVEHFSIENFKSLIRYGIRTTRSKKRRVFRFLKFFAKRTNAGVLYSQDEELLGFFKDFALKDDVKTLKIFLQFLAYFFKNNSEAIKKLLDLKLFTDLNKILNYNMQKIPEKISFFICSALNHCDTESFEIFKQLNYLNLLFRSSLLVNQRKYLENVMITFQTLVSRDGNEFLKKYAKKILVFKKHCQKNSINFIEIKN